MLLDRYAHVICGGSSLLFGAMVVGSGIQYLDKTTSTTMLVAWVILLIKQVFF